MKKYKWIEECIIVNGHVRSCIYDLPRQKSYFVDKNTESLIQKIESLDSNFIEDNLDSNELEWFNFFIEKELLFEVPISQLEYFKKIPLGWNHPSKIVNAILEESIYLNKTLKFLNELNCHHIVLSFQNSKDILKVLEDNFKTTFLKSLDIVVEQNVFESNYYETLITNYPIISDIYIKKSTKKIISIRIDDFRRILKVDSSTKGKLTFSVEIKLFMESHFYNVYLNRKIYFNKEGYIYNTPESNVKLGNINNITTAEDLHQLSKTKEWDSKKSETFICEDCELRYMCVDNRIPKWNKQLNKWQHETECDYNPYIGLWKGEEGYLSLKKCGKTFNEDGLKTDKIKLDSINKILWS